ncbi:MAG TPA: phosphoenolpyruvate--protein phosphotransferase [Brevundimonas sp.]|nr:phosphoenolpyruvate--protein phosphotransferase [Brevundimonas sp.]
MMPAGGAMTRGPRNLLRQIREALGGAGAGATPAQDRLNMVVQIIARSMVAEVCSIYLRRASGELELFATEGLNPGAVHNTRLRPGEGLVGEVARTAQPISLSDAPSHPAFSYRPETGEDPYHAFLGAPLLRGGRAIGVLVVQNRTERRYDEDEVEDIQTIAMVLAETVSSGELLDQEELRDVELAPHRPERLKGQKFGDGLAFGHVVLHEAPLPPEKLLAEDPGLEEARLKLALASLKTGLDAMLDKGQGLAGPSFEVLETYRMFADDRGWNRSLEEAVRNGLTAEAAVDRVRNEHRARFAQARDHYIRERLHDFEDLANRLLRVLAGDKPGERELPDDAIVVARNLGPADLLEYPRDKLKGLLLEEGSAASHAAIVARALQIPCVGRLMGLRDRLSEGDMVIADGETGEAYLRPRPDMIEAVQSRMAVRDQRRAQFAQLRDTPAVTLDGQRISLLTNAGLAVDLENLNETGAEGIGLFRTEFQFLVSATLPQREKQQRLYKDVLDAAGDRPVIFRTVDIGGDKALPYMQRDGDEELEDNPAMGWRALRLALDRDGLMKAQARALLEASAGKVLNIMFPMVSEPWEYEAARDLVEHQREWLQGHRKKLPIAVKYGAMLEVPALAEVLDLLLPRVDFLSIGTNDLTQFLFAADRAHPKLAERYDWLSIAILRFLDRVVRACVAHQVPVGVCGEMGGRTLEAMALIGLGIRRLSITPASVGPVKAMIRAIDATQLQSTMREWLDSGAPDIRERLTQWASDRDVELT